MTPRRAVFLDRDGTLVDDPGFLRDPDDVRLLPGAADAVRLLNAAGVPAVVVTNQSGIGRGLISEPEYRLVSERFEWLLKAEGAHLDALYHCPHAPERDGPCDCRKPGPLLYRRAAEDLGLDLGQSWWVGDRPSDVEPARVFGGQGILVRTGEAGYVRGGEGIMAVATVDDAVRHILEGLARP